MKAKSLKHTTLSILLLLLSISSSAQTDSVKNIIFLIGDGMGINQVYAAILESKEELNIEEFPYSGFSKTYSYDNAITDSGAGGTALACGVKTRNGMIGLLPDSTSTPSIMEKLKASGMSTGLVVTCNVTHATPASFVAHQISRKLTDRIAEDYLKSNIDLFIGGGKNDFEKRKDNRNISSELRTKGYDIIYNLDSIKDKDNKLGILLADNHLPKTKERNNQLAKSTKLAIDKLSKNKNGFFLMVEGSQIDWEGHKNNKRDIVEEVLDFDKAIGICLEFARENKNTLVIVTADHETGGLCLLDNGNNKKAVDLKFTTTEHSASLVPIFSFGPNADKFCGIRNNTEFFSDILKMRNLK